MPGARSAHCGPGGLAAWLAWLISTSVALLIIGISFEIISARSHAKLGPEHQPAPAPPTTDAMCPSRCWSAPPTPARTPSASAAALGLRTRPPLPTAPRGSHTARASRAAQASAESRALSGSALAAGHTHRGRPAGPTQPRRRTSCTRPWPTHTMRSALWTVDRRCAMSSTVRCSPQLIAWSSASCTTACRSEGSSRSSSVARCNLQCTRWTPAARVHHHCRTRSPSHLAVRIQRRSRLIQKQHLRVADELRARSEVRHGRGARAPWRAAAARAAHPPRARSQCAASGRR